MPDSPQDFPTEPLLASTLLNLEFQFLPSEVQRQGQWNGLRVESVDPRFSQLWCGGSVVGLGAADSDSHEVRRMVCWMLEAVKGGKSCV